MIEKPFLWLQRNWNRRWVYLYGGASSGKSWAMAQYLIIEKWLKEKHIGILALRKVRPAVRTSCWETVRYWIGKLGIVCGENRSEMVLTAPNGNLFRFDGLDNIFKKRSTERLNYIWIEEAAGIGHEAAFTDKEVLQLNMLCRAANVNGLNQMFLTFNPIDPIGNSWLKDRCDRANVDGKSAAMMINHQDNPFLAVEEHRQIEMLADQDPEYDKIYRQGLWATPTNLIYSNWDIVSDMPDRFDERIWGLDFGYSSNPAALIEIRIVGNDFYECERLYQQGLTNPELIDKLQSAIENRNDMIVADSAEPKSIQEIMNAGFNVHPSDKGPDSVRHGINTVQALKVHITADSANLIAEKRGYKWKIDSKGNPMTAALKYKDHLMDAERYAICKIKRIVKADVVILGQPAEVEDDFDSAEIEKQDRYG